MSRFKYHPDNKNSEVEKQLCNRQMMVINAAYKVLKDPETRAKYDQKRRISKSASQTSNVSNKSNSNSFRRNVAEDRDRNSYRPPTADTRDEIQVESLADIVNELLQDMLTPKGRSGLFEEFVSFLEGSASPSEVVPEYS